MFERGHLLRFEPFIFKNGMPPKPKFFVVLGQMDTDVILASLPTSKDHVPSKYDGLYGCINDDEQQFNVFKFKAGESVTDSFAFGLDTYIYGEQLDRFPLSVFRQQEISGQTTIIDLGIVTEPLFQQLILCLKNSSRVKRIFKQYLA